jgi:hypothetical protein
MTKFLIVIIILAGVYLFYPFRDLYVREDPFSQRFHPRGQGFWTLDSCKSAAAAQNAIEFHCRKRTNLGRFLNTSNSYVTPSVE